MRTAREILQEAGLPPPPQGQNRFYALCPRCSGQRSAAHKKSKCLGISITAEGVAWGCNHCDFKGGAFYNGKDNDPVIATYEYTDESGRILFRKVRTKNKKFWQQHPDGNGGWVSGIKSIRRVLYRLQELIEDIAADHVVLIVEGEKDADNLHRIGIPATVIRKVRANPNRNRSGGRITAKRCVMPILSSFPIMMLPVMPMPMRLPNYRTALPRASAF
jgi:hypothetical protein